MESTALIVKLTAGVTAYDVKGRDKSGDWLKKRFFDDPARGLSGKEQAVNFALENFDSYRFKQVHR